MVIERIAMTNDSTEVELEIKALCERVGYETVVHVAVDLMHAREEHTPANQWLLEIAEANARERARRKLEERKAAVYTNLMSANISSRLKAALKFVFLPNVKV